MDVKEKKLKIQNPEGLCTNNELGVGSWLGKLVGLKVVLSVLTSPWSLTNCSKFATGNC